MERSELVEVLVAHQRVSIEHCHCRKLGLGQSHAEHIADELEKAGMVWGEPQPYEYSVGYPITDPLSGKVEGYSTDDYDTFPRYEDALRELNGGSNWLDTDTVVRRRAPEINEWEKATPPPAPEEEH